MAKTKSFFRFLGFPNHTGRDAQNVFAKGLGRFVGLWRVGEYRIPQETFEEVQISVSQKR